jgi:hypothetical protein
MGMPSDVAADVYRRLGEINRLAQEIKDVPNLGPSVWDMKGIDEKCRLIQDHAKVVYDATQRHIGTGESRGPGHSNTGDQ